MSQILQVYHAAIQTTGREPCGAVGAIWSGTWHHRGESRQKDRSCVVLFALSTRKVPVRNWMGRMLRGGGMSIESSVEGKNAPLGGGAW
ncbi:MAG: hypothetical protein ACLFSB_14820 [Chitinispirillaceae bacterium]